MTTERRVLLGRIAGVFGVRGEVRIESWTDPPRAILRYQPWLLRHRDSERAIIGVKGRDAGRGIVATLPEITDREQAHALIGAELWVPREALPPPAAGEYYWIDLEGLSVETVDGVVLGRVSHLFATGSNDVIVVQGDRERMIPWLDGEVVKSVTFDGTRADGGLMVVDWDPDF